MRKTLSAALSAVMLCALCAAPAHALEYSFAAPDVPLFARSTSDDTIHQ